MSITLSLPSLSLTLKILLASRSSIKGAVFSYSICYWLSLMPPSIASIYCAVLVALILSVSKIMPFCSYCVKKGLVCVTITALSGCQPLSCTKYTKSNIYVSCNIYFVLSAKYIYCFTLLNYLVLCLSCYRVLDLICC